MSADRSPAAPAAGRPDLHIPGGCPTCGGDLAVRVSEDGRARSVCLKCVALGEPRLWRDAGGMHVMHRVAAA